MRLRTLIIFLFITFGSRPIYARAAESILQDTAKKVTVKVVVSEKQSALDFDSLLNSNATVKPEKRPSRVKKSQRGEKQGSPEIRKSTQQVEKKPASKLSRPEKSALKKSTVTSNSADRTKAVKEEEHSHEEIASVQVTDDQSVVHEPDVQTSRTYLWVGFMLIIVGVILGILFGKTALLISIAGMVFVIIGYTIQR